MTWKHRIILALACCGTLLGLRPSVLCGQPVAPRTGKGIWTSPQELAAIPATGVAWKHLRDGADAVISPPNLKNQDDNNNVAVLAKALVYARTGEAKYRDAVVANCLQAMGTEQGGRTLALGRNLAAYVIAADLVVLDPDADARFRAWLRTTLTAKLDGRTLRSTHEDRPNNWGTHAGASRAAIAVYLDDRVELERTATVFKGYLGDRSSYADFKYGDLAWQADAAKPVGVNLRGATRDGHLLDGLLPEEMRRASGFQWPPKSTGYPWEALQGAVVQAEILHRAGFSAWEWEDRALLRAAEALYRLSWAAKGDDQWIPWLINYRYGTQFPTANPARFGKTMGWTDWTHARR